MKISLVIPTNRVSYSALARVFEAASLDPEKFELIVRDNSENEAKRALLAKIEAPNLRLFTVPNRGGFENSIEALQLASGEFAFFLSDDDWLSVNGLYQLHEMGTKFHADESVIGLNGLYLIDTSTTSGLFGYKGLDSVDAAQRVTGFIQANGPNMIFYSAVRRPLMTFCFKFMEALPYKFSFHDQLMSLMYLALGRFLTIERVVYFYDHADWETLEGTLSKDRSSYTNAGLPIEVDRLHWLICGLEGALLLNSQLMRNKGTFDRGQLANLWFAANFGRFKHWSRELGYAETESNAITMKIRDKWLGDAEVNLHELLLDVCNAFEVADPEGARRYFDFWSTV